MSGLEIAGIVLGAFPVLTQGLKQFREWAKTAEHFKHIHLEYNRWLSELGVQELYFKNHLKTLLLPTLIDDARIRALLADPSGPGWKEETVVAAIRTRLGDGFELYLQCLEGMHDTLQEMREELPLSDDSMQKYIQISSAAGGQSLNLFSRLRDRDVREFQRFRLRFSSREDQRRRLLSGLQDHNSRLKGLLASRDDYAHLEEQRASKAQSSPAGDGICRFWRRAGGAFRALAMAWGCACEQHETSLLLEYRVMAMLDFQLMFLQSGRELHSMKMVEIVWDQGLFDIFQSERTFRGSGTPGGPGVTPTVRQNPVPSCSQTGLGHSFADASGKSTTNLCQSVHRLDMTDYGYVVQEDRAYSIRSTKRCSSDNFRYLTLNQILKSTSANLLTLKHRRDAALVLASSFVQLFDSPWLKTLTKDEIRFLQDNDTITRLDLPVLGKNTSPYALINMHQANLAASVQEIVEAIDQLGITLLELCFGTTIESRPERLRLQGARNEREHFVFDAIAARVWQSEVVEKDYAEAVSWCLGGNRCGVDWSLDGNNTTSDAWRLTMLQKVVQPLKRSNESLSFVYPGQSITV